MFRVRVSDTKVIPVQRFPETPDPLVGVETPDRGSTGVGPFLPSPTSLTRTRRRGGRSRGGFDPLERPTEPS